MDTQSTSANEQIPEGIKKSDWELLSDEEQLLMKQLEDIRKRKAEIAELERKKREASKPVTVIASEFDYDNSWVYFTNTYREDLIEYLRGFKSRNYDGRRNRLSRDEFLIMYGELQYQDALLNVSFRGSDGQREDESIYTRIINNVSLPHYTICIEQKKQYKVVLANNATGNPMNGIPGTRWNYDDNAYLVPLSEGWRLYGNLTSDYIKQHNFRVVWSDEALHEAVTQAEKRSKIMELHNPDHESSIKDDLDAMLGLSKPDANMKFRNFQAVGIEYAEALGGRWMCGDQTGLGKSWQYIGYVMRQLEKNPDYKCIICCPANLMINWMRMVKLLTNYQPYSLQGTKPLAIDMAHMLKGTTPFFVINYDILSTRNEFEIKSKNEQGFDVIEKVEQWPWVEAILKMDFNSIAFDEAHYLKNVDSLRSRAGRKLTDIPSVMLATATPVVNRVDELWPLLHIVDPHTFAYQQTFVNQYSADGKHAKNVNELRELMKFIMIRRMKKDVQKDLPEFNNIVRYHKLSGKAMKLYDKILSGVWEIMADWDPDNAGKETSITHMLAQIIRLKQVCAIDKAEMVADLATYIRDNEPEDEPNPKVIIFSQFVAVAKAIHNRLNDGGRSRMFSGQTPAHIRMQMVDEFQNNPDVDYLVMTSQVAAEGLTLTKASSVIFADLMWTPKDHEQCIGRAWGRLNDSHGVDVFWCIADNTIEDWINQMLADKRALIGQVIDGKEVVGDESVASELLKKMRAEMFQRKGKK